MPAVAPAEVVFPSSAAVWFASEESSAAGGGAGAGAGGAGAGAGAGAGVGGSRPSVSVYVSVVSGRTSVVMIMFLVVVDGATVPTDYLHA